MELLYGVDVMRNGILVTSIGVILCDFLESVYLYYQHIESKNVYIILKINVTLGEVAKQLKEKNIIKSQGTFMFYAKVKGMKKSLEDRNFIIKPKTNLNDLITKLKDGKSEFTVITIHKGLLPGSNSFTGESFHRG